MLRPGIVHRLDFYNEEDLTTVIVRSARILGVPTDARAATAMARRSVSVIFSAIAESCAPMVVAKPSRKG